MKCCYFVLCCIVAISCSQSKKNDRFAAEFAVYPESEGRSFKVNFFNNGVLKEVIGYKSDVPEGKTYFFHENGKLRELSEFSNGLRIGEVLEYDTTGLLLRYSYYNEPGQLVYEKEYKDGQLIKEEGKRIIPFLDTSLIKKDSVLSISIKVIVPPDVMNYVTHLTLYDNSGSVVDKVESIKDLDFDYDINLEQQLSRLEVASLFQEFTSDSLVLVKFTWKINKTLGFHPTDTVKPQFEIEQQGVSR